MRPLKILTIAALAMATSSLPVIAEMGGDREPAGGAFMSSYGRPAAQTGTPPRSADVPAAAPEALERPATTGSIPADRAPVPRR